MGKNVIPKKYWINLDKEYETLEGDKVIFHKIIFENSSKKEVTFPIKGNIIIKRKNKKSKFLIHCSAGISRSAGTACAVECIVNNNNNIYEYQTSHSDVKSFNRYFPNLVVFDKIVQNKELNIEKEIQR